MSESPPEDTKAAPAAGASPPGSPLQRLHAAVLDASAAVGGGAATAGRAGPTLERPRRAEFGDYSTNAALLLAPVLGEQPREVAARLGAELAGRLGAGLERYEVAGPGFLNLFLSDAWLRDAAQTIAAAGGAYGSAGASAPERILVEFVSANPTGPMHVGHARNAAYGDSLARLLAFHGHSVEREFYVNDAGTQIRKLGETIAALAAGEEVPEGGYHGEYVQQLVPLAQSAGTDPQTLGHAAVGEMLGQMRRSLAAFGVGEFDTWAFESQLYAGEPSPVEHTLGLLAEKGWTYESDGALWMRTTDFGDDKDRVLVRGTGEYTYFASDIAYHQDKRERGFERQLDVWGADHHGYIGRMKGAYQALGGDPDHLELLIMQLVHLVHSGERAQMSKRAGEFVTLEDLVGEVGVDAARWYLLARSHDTTLDLDLDLAREQSAENPVYYVQYAHARVCSVLAKAQAQGPAAREDGHGGAPSALHAAERALVALLLAFPGEVQEAAERRAPHRIAAYALELAQGFTAFYRDCRVVGAESAAQEELRLTLCRASATVIASALALLGVSAPQEM